MAKKKVFVSFDYETDYNLKGSLIGQAKQPDSPFAVSDVSLKEREPEQEWLAKAKAAIAGCDVFVVILGRNTHSAPGVIKEIEIAKGMNKPRFQLMPQRKDWRQMDGAGCVVDWKWANLKKKLA